MLPEKSVIKCRECGELRTRYLDGTYDGLNKRWRDKEGKVFNGKVCPECHLFRTKVNMRKMRKRVKDASSDQGNP